MICLSFLAHLVGIVALRRDSEQKGIVVTATSLQKNISAVKIVNISLFNATSPAEVEEYVTQNAQDIEPTFQSGKSPSPSPSPSPAWMDSGSRSGFLQTAEVKPSESSVAMDLKEEAPPQLLAWASAAEAWVKDLEDKAPAELLARFDPQAAVLRSRSSQGDVFELPVRKELKTIDISHDGRPGETDDSVDSPASELPTTIVPEQELHESVALKVTPPLNADPFPAAELRKAVVARMVRFGLGFDEAANLIKAVSVKELGIAYDKIVNLVKALEDLAFTDPIWTFGGEAWVKSTSVKAWRQGEVIGLEPNGRVLVRFELVNGFYRMRPMGKPPKSIAKTENEMESDYMYNYRIGPLAMFHVLTATKESQEGKDHAGLNHVIYANQPLEWKGRLWTVMPYMNKETLFQHIELKTWSRAFLTALWYQSLLGASYLHISGLIHRDIKPDHVLIHCRSDDVKSDLAQPTDPQTCTAKVIDMDMAVISEATRHLTVTFSDLILDEARWKEDCGLPPQPLSGERKEKCLKELQQTFLQKREQFMRENKNFFGSLNDGRPWLLSQVKASHYEQLLNNDALPISLHGCELLDEKQYPLTWVWHLVQPRERMWGTAEYLAPEAIKEEKTKESSHYSVVERFAFPSTDLWALGTILSSIALHAPPSPVWQHGAKTEEEKMKATKEYSKLCVRRKQRKETDSLMAKIEPQELQAMVQGLLDCSPANRWEPGRVKEAIKEVIKKTAKRDWSHLLKFDKMLVDLKAIKRRQDSEDRGENIEKAQVPQVSWRHVGFSLSGEYPLWYMDVQEQKKYMHTYISVRSVSGVSENKHISEVSEKKLDPAEDAFRSCSKDDRCSGVKYTDGVYFLLKADQDTVEVKYSMVGSGRDEWWWKEAKRRLTTVDIMSGVQQARFALSEYDLRASTIRTFCFEKEGDASTQCCNEKECLGVAEGPQSNKSPYCLLKAGPDTYHSDTIQLNEVKNVKGVKQLWKKDEAFPETLQGLKTVADELRVSKTRRDRIQSAYDEQKYGELESLIKETIDDIKKMHGVKVDHKLPDEDPNLEKYLDMAYVGNGRFPQKPMMPNAALTKEWPRSMIAKGEVEIIGRCDPETDLTGNSESIKFHVLLRKEVGRRGFRVYGSDDHGDFDGETKLVREGSACTIGGGCVFSCEYKEKSKKKSDQFTLVMHYDTSDNKKHMYRGSVTYNLDNGGKKIHSCKFDFKGDERDWGSSEKKNEEIKFQAATMWIQHQSHCPQDILSKETFSTRYSAKARCLKRRNCFGVYDKHCAQIPGEIFLCDMKELQQRYKTYSKKEENYTLSTEEEDTMVESYLAYWKISQDPGDCVLEKANKETLDRKHVALPRQLTDCTLRRQVEYTFCGIDDSFSEGLDLALDLASAAGRFVCCRCDIVFSSTYKITKYVPTSQQECSPLD